jgi:hypothetical protein
MNVTGASATLHAILMRMMDKVDETTKRNLTLRMEEMEKRAEMKAAEKHLSFREMLNNSVSSEQNTDKAAVDAGSDSVNSTVHVFPQNYSERRALAQSKSITVN